jgi:hypothetical protein
MREERLVIPNKFRENPSTGQSQMLLGRPDTQMTGHEAALIKCEKQDDRDQPERDNRKVSPEC